MCVCFVYLCVDNESSTSSCTHYWGIWSFQSGVCQSNSPWLLAKRSPPSSSSNTHTRVQSHFHICSVSHFYICNPCSFVILPLPVSLKREKLISGAKGDYQMQTKSPPPPDKDIDVDFSWKQKVTQSLLQHGLQLSRKKQLNCHTGNYSLSALGSQLHNGRETLSWQSEKHKLKWLWGA